MKSYNMKSFLLIVLLGISSISAAQNLLDLSGNWELALDSTDVGEKEGWYLKSFSDNISLPGTTDLARKGTSNRLVPKLEKPQLLRLTRKNAYVGVAWYKREINIPKSMAGQPLEFSFERVLWQSRLWIDGEEVAGAQESLIASHRFVMPKGLSAGKHIIALRIDNRKRYDISANDLAHAYTNDTQIMWNGVLGKMKLTARQKVSIQHVNVYPDVRNGKIRGAVTLENSGHKPEKVKLALQVGQPEGGQKFVEKEFQITLQEGRQKLEYDYSLGTDMKKWDEFTPELYNLSVVCRFDRKKTERKDVSFGMREIDNGQGILTVNGNRIFLRGTLECCIFPLTGTPPMTEEGWMKVFATAKEWGLNHLRFHSWCPPEAAFCVADKLGFYLQVELPNWSYTIGKDEAMTQFLYNEFDRIVEAYGNHPSFCMMSVGNELQYDFKLLNDMVRYMKGKDSRRLYTTSTFTFEKGHGAKPEPEDDFFVTQWTDKGWVRGQGIFDQEPPCFYKDYSAAMQDMNVPLISHEIGQYAVFPNLKEIEKYTGVLEPLNFKAVKQDLQKKGLYSKAEDFLEASGKLAVLLYKEEIERAMKTKQFSGFQLLDLHDFPGQGTALVGLLDAFWDSKGLIEASAFRQFCAPVVPLARFAKAVYSGDEMFSASIEVVNYSNAAIDNKQIMWQLADEAGTQISNGRLNVESISKGTVTQCGDIRAELKSVRKASKLYLTVSVEGTEWKNTWPVWVYPRIESLNVGDVLLTQDVEEALAALKQGRKVLFSPKMSYLKGLEGKFLPVFWSPVHFPRQAGTMGLLCNTQHAALRHFPTEMHSNWQWWNLVKRSKVLVVDSLPPVEPIVESIDNFTNNRKLVSVFETKCGKGKLIMSAMDILSEGSDKPEIQQMLYSLVTYMNSESFAPRTMLGEEDIRSLILKNEGKVIETKATSIYRGLD